MFKYRKKYGRLMAACLAIVLAFTPAVAAEVLMPQDVMAATSTAKPTESRITSLNTSVVSGVNTVSLSWSKAENTTNYRIYYKQSGGSWELMKSLGSAKTSATLSSSSAHPINTGVTYYFTVRTYNKNSGKYGLWDKTGTKVCFQSAQTATPGRSDITSAVTSVKSGVNTIDLTWNKAENTTNYKVYYKEVAGTWKKIKTFDSSKTSATIKSTSANPFDTGMYYIFTVRTYNSNSKKWGAWNKTGTKVAFTSQGQSQPSKPAEPTQPPKPGEVKVDQVKIVGNDMHGDTHSLAEGSFKIDVVLYPSNATDKSLRWTSSNPAVATVSSDGTVTMKAGGTTTIDIYANGAKTYYELVVIDPNVEAQKIFELTNQERIKNGKAPLKYSMLMQQSCMIRANEISTKFLHQRPDGRNFGTSLEDLGGGSNLSENIISVARGITNPAETAVTQWMNSSGHRAAILSTSQYMGVGVYLKENGMLYCVQQFANFDPEKTVTVSLDNNGGTGPTSATFLNQKKVYQKDLPVPTRPGYTFKGWTLPNHDNVIFKSVTVQDNYKETFVAVWEPV